MTLTEALAAGIRRVRTGTWNKYAHLEFRPYGQGIGVVGTLRDVRAEMELPLVNGELDYDGWEPWTPPEDVARIAVAWPTYRE